MRGNGKIIQELEAEFRGAGWNVIKVIWGGRWDPLLAADHDGLLVRRMEEAVDGEYQTYKSRNGAYVREKFFGAYPELAERVAHMSDEEIWLLNRGGHDPRKVYAAYAAAVEHTGEPTVILAKTIKGYGMGEAGEGQNITHQQKKMTDDALLAFRTRFELDLTDDEVHARAFHKPADDTPEMAYLREHRAALGGSLPARKPTAPPLRDPGAGRLQVPAGGHRRARDLDHDGVRPDPVDADPRQEIGHQVVPIVARRVTDVRHGGDVPPARDLQPGRPALRARGPRAADVLQGGQARPDPPGGDQRAGRHVVVDRGGDVVRQSRRGDDPVLRLLLDVRLPARAATSPGPPATRARAAS